MPQCYLCKNSNLGKVNGKLRDLPDTKILKCNDCGLVFLENFNHITRSFYQESNMHSDPMGKREFIEHEMDDNRRFEYCKPLIYNKKLLDCGCGDSTFLFKSKAVAKIAHGLEPDLTKQEKYQQLGLKIFTEIGNITDRYDVITLFHVMEHLPDPICFLNKLKHYLSENGKMIIEVPNANEALLTLYKNPGFSNFYWSCHLFLFNPYTLEMILQKAGFHIHYIQQVQRYPLSNHLYWLAHNNPGGHIQWHFIDTPELNAEYERALSRLGICDTLVALISI